MNIFSSQNYKEILSDVLKERKRLLGRSYSFQNMARHCRVQKTYISKVLRNDGDLSDDQLYLACDFLGLSDDERAYLFLLHDFQRTVVPKRKADLTAQINAIQVERQRSENYIEAKTFAPLSDEMIDYHLDPNMVLVHMFLTIPRFSKNVSLIGEQLDLSKEHLASLITKLQRMGVVEVQGGICKVKVEKTHVSNSSPIYRAYSALQRIKSVDRIQKLKAEQTYNFSVVFSADEKTRAEIRQSFLTFLSALQPKVTTAPAEQVYQMNFDLFPWTKVDAGLG